MELCRPTHLRVELWILSWSQIALDDQKRRWYTCVRVRLATFCFDQTNFVIRLGWQARGVFTFLTSQVQGEIEARYLGEEMKNSDETTL